MLECEKCHKWFPPVKLGQHISHSIKSGCKEFYGPRLQDLKKENRSKRRKEAYNREKEKKRKSLYYSTNQDKIREKYRNKARAKKADSDENLSKYRQDTRFGPEFVCICCHEGLFENQVLIFSKSREKKLGQELIKDSCMIRS